MYEAKWLERAAIKKLRDEQILADYDAGMRVREITPKHRVSTTTVYCLIDTYRHNYAGRARDEDGVYKWNGRKWMPALKWELRDWLGAE